MFCDEVGKPFVCFGGPVASPPALQEVDVRLGGRYSPRPDGANAATTFIGDYFGNITGAAPSGDSVDYTTSAGRITRTVPSPGAR